MKKIFALVLALILCLLLAACGQEKAAESEGPRSDVAVTPIPKPGEDSAGKTETPAAPAATEKPAPADIYVTDKCDIKGTATYNAGYYSYFSFTLPEISGVHTDYVQAANAEFDRIYNVFVTPSLEAMQEDGYPEHYCTAYTHAETDGVHSILVSCDSDWGENYYHCFNFDAWGEEVDNAALLALVGMTPDSFVKAARAYLTDATDLSEYFEDDGWKDLQKQTIADDNCNADMPMAILPNGNLCFIATIYTPAGAGVYDYALELHDGGDITGANLGRIAIDRIWGSYVVEDPGEGGEDLYYMLDFFPIGDTLTAEVTAFDRETGSVYSYYAADIIPEDPEDLLRADREPIPVRVLTYCPDIFGGTYYGETAYYNMTIDSDSVTFSDFIGGTPFITEEFTAWSAYYEDYDLSRTVPDTDYDHFDYDTTERSGIPGVWTGSYTDTDYNVHSLTLELTNYGELWLRDCVDGEIPRTMGGSYYIAGADDDFAEEEGMVVFNLVTIGGYKMPYMGACWIYTNDDGTLDVYDTEEEYSMSMLLRPSEYICTMQRVPALRYSTWNRSVTPLAEGETFESDVMGTGEMTEYSYTLVRDKNAGDAITAISFSLNGEESTLDDLWIYEADVYVVEPGHTGAVYFYIDGLSDNDYHYTDIVAADDTDFRYVGYFRGGFGEEPWDPECMALDSRCALLSTVGVSRSYRVGLGGMPEPIDPFFYAVGDMTLTAKKDIDAWKSDVDSGEILYDVVLPAGTEVTLLRTDAASFWDLVDDDGECYRVWVDDSGEWPQTIGGENIYDCFDGILFAG